MVVERNARTTGPRIIQFRPRIRPYPSCPTNITVSPKTAERSYPSTVPPPAADFEIERRPFYGMISIRTDIDVTYRRGKYEKFVFVAGARAFFVPTPPRNSPARARYDDGAPFPSAPARNLRNTIRRDVFPAISRQSFHQFLLHRPLIQRFRRNHVRRSN